MTYLKYCNIVVTYNETLQILQLTAEIYAAYQQTAYIAIHGEILQTLRYIGTYCDLLQQHI